jgi:hypothetical protein
MFGYLVRLNATDLAHVTGGGQPDQAVAHRARGAPQGLGDRRHPQRRVLAVRIDELEDESVELAGTQPLGGRLGGRALIPRAGRPAVGQPASALAPTPAATSHPHSLEGRQRLADG